MATTSKTGDYDPIYKELDKLDALYANTGRKSASAKSKTKSIPASLDALLASLHDAKQQLASRNKSVAEVAISVTAAVSTSKKEIDDRQKEIYNSLNRMGKALDKVCSCSVFIIDFDQYPSFGLSLLEIHGASSKLWSFIHLPRSCCRAGSGRCNAPSPHWLVRCCRNIHPSQK